MERGLSTNNHRAISGLRHALDVLPAVAGVSFSYFDAGDVVRHPLVQRIVRAYEERGPVP